MKCAPVTWGKQSDFLQTLLHYEHCYTPGMMETPFEGSTDNPEKPAQG